MTTKLVRRIETTGYLPLSIREEEVILPKRASRCSSLVRETIQVVGSGAGTLVGMTFFPLCGIAFLHYFMPSENAATAVMPLPLIVLGAGIGANMGKKAANVFANTILGKEKQD